MCSRSISVKNELNSIEDEFKNICLDLNIDNEIKEESWNNYKNLLKHYVLEGDQLHWLSVSLFVTCKKNSNLNNKLINNNNPISITRLLKNLKSINLIIFFDKLHKWINMLNLPDYITKNIIEIENSFNISSIIYQKYLNLFLEFYNGDQNKLIEFNYLNQRIDFQLNQKYKQKKLNTFYLYQFIWTIYALSKTIYPLTSNDLIASFHLLLASNLFVYKLIQNINLNNLIKLINLNDINLIINKYQCSSSILNIIYEQHLNKLFNINLNQLNENKFFELIRFINNQYDEFILTNSIIDERIFIENNLQLNDLLNSLNENRNQKSIDNRTPLTIQQQFINNNKTNINLTPISQTNQLILFLLNLINKQTIKPSTNLINLINQQTYLDYLIDSLNQYKHIYLNKINNLNQNDNCFGLNQIRFDYSLKLFYLILENLFITEKQKTNSNQNQIQQSLLKLILNNDFIKSLLGISMLIVFYCYSDKIHDLNWILNLYSLQGYSFIKIIQIVLKSSKEITQSRIIIKYLTSIQEIILSSMVFKKDSSLWNDIKLKGIIYFKQIYSYYLQQQLNNNNTFKSPNNHFIDLYNQSPLHNNNHVKRNLFQNTTTNQSNNELTIIRSRSDPIVENSLKLNLKMCPYTMFYRKLYDLVICRLNLLCLRLFGSKSNEYDKIIWNLFLFLFENYLEELFCSRDLDQILLSTIYYTINSNLIQSNNQQQLTWFRLSQAYKSIPNSKLKTLRSVFIRSINENNSLINNQHIHDKDPCLTPSKPAGTIHIIDGNVFGDISSFYNEIFLKIDNIENKINEFFKENNLIDFPIRNKINENNNEHISINIGQNIFVDYSSNKIDSNISINNYQFNQINSNQNQFNQSNNILSSTIQAGLNNRVQTTRTRTSDGKFLTTISTSYKLNNSTQQQSSEEENQNENQNDNLNSNQFLFGQSTINSSFKRTLSQDSNSNSLNSLTKKVLLIENDRQSTNQLN